MTLLILCVDGFDPDYAQENGFTMPYERKLTIPKELHYSGSPHTLFVWPSILTGEPQTHRGFIDRQRKNQRTGLRKIINGYLANHGIRWTREGLKIRKRQERSIFDTSFVAYDPEIEKTLLDNYHSYKFNIPGVSYGFLLGGNVPYSRQQYQTFRLLANIMNFTDYEIAAIYTALIDHLSHRNLNPKPIYADIIACNDSFGSRYC